MMTCRTLIEHLSQFDPDMEVKIRDQEIGLILRDFPSHAVELERFISNSGDEQEVVALG
jgi:hypothetical protein